MNSAVIVLAANTICFLVVLRVVNNWKINPLSPVSIFNIGFFYSYFFSGFLLQYDIENFLVYKNIWKEPEYPLWVYFLPAWIGILSFNIGYMVRQRNLSGSLNEHIQTRLQSKFRAALPLTLLFLAIISALGIFASIDLSLYDLITNLESWELLRDLVIKNWADANYLYVLPVYIAFFHLCVLSTTNFTRLQKAGLFGLVLITLTIVGSRALTLSWIISLLVYREQSGRPFPTVVKYLALMFIAVGGAIFGIIQKVTTDSLSAQELDFPFNLFRRLQSSYEQFENLVNLINTNFSFDFGRSIFEDVFITYIPRIIFPWKPVDVGYLRAQNVLFYEDFWSIDRVSSYPVGIIGELYFNLWYIGIILGMFFLGWLLRRLELLAKSDISYLPVICTMAGTFLAPHRTFGTLLMSIAMFSVFILANKKISAVLFPSRSLRHH